MRFIFFLSQENILLSKFELQTILRKEPIVEGNLAFAECDKRLDFSCLAMTKQANIFLFSCEKKEIKEKIRGFNWNKYYENSFYLSTVHLPKGISKKYLSDIIYDRINNPKVNVTSPKTVFQLIFSGNIVYATVRKWINKDRFELRKAHRRTEHHPTSLHPKLAKALVNMTGIKKGTIIDPFCGSGGIILEASLLGLRPIGYDIDNIMLKRARLNLEDLNLKNFSLKLKDARDIEKCNYVVTDPPYGISSKGDKNIHGLYKDFIKELSKKLKKRGVMVFPDNFHYREILEKNSFEILSSFKWYIHKKMTRNIVVFEPRTH